MESSLYNRGTRSWGGDLDRMWTIFLIPLVVTCDIRSRRLRDRDQEAKKFNGEWQS